MGFGVEAFVLRLEERPGLPQILKLWLKSRLFRESFMLHLIVNPGKLEDGFGRMNAGIPHILP